MRVSIRLVLLVAALGVGLAYFGTSRPNESRSRPYDSLIDALDQYLEQLRKTLPQARARWQETNPGHYRMRLHVSTAFDSRNIEVEVLDGKLVKRICTPRGTFDGCELNPLDTYTVEQLFSEAERFETHGRSVIQALREAPAEQSFMVDGGPRQFLNLQLETSYGYPKTIWYDSPFVSDTFFGIEAEEFEPLD